MDCLIAAHASGSSAATAATTASFLFYNVVPAPVRCWSAAAVAAAATGA